MKRTTKYQKLSFLIALFFVFFGFDLLFLNNESLSTFKYLYRLNSFQFVAYTSTLIINLLALSLVFFIKESKKMGLLAALIALTYGMDLVYAMINGDGFCYKDIAVAMMEGNNMAGNPFIWKTTLTFLPNILKAGGIVLGLMSIVSLLRTSICRYNLFMPTKIIFSTLIGASLLSFYIQNRTLQTLNQFPSPFKVLNTSIYYSLHPKYYGKRDILKLKPNQQKVYKNIIWIIEESVGGNYLSLNGYPKKTTPYLDSLKSGILNLGLANSCTNCSSTSNIILMSGLSESELPDKTFKALKKSTIFQYAKNAGYNTAYISGQGIQENLLNYMTKYDLPYIDYFYQPEKAIAINEQVFPEQDLVKNIEQQLAENESNFIYVVKRGAHFPFGNNYPENKKYYQPVLAKNEAITFANKNKTFNSYQNSIRWRVDEFFSYFFNQTKLLEREDLLIIYTSDHGQSILENNITSTHCTSKNPPASQGVVPFILFGKTVTDLEIPKAFKNRANHFLIFPSTLKLMGYDTPRANLFDRQPPTNQYFYHRGIFGESQLAKTSITNK